MKASNTLRNSGGFLAARTEEHLPAEDSEGSLQAFRRGEEKHTRKHEGKEVHKGHMLYFLHLAIKILKKCRQYVRILLAFLDYAQRFCEDACAILSE